MPSNNEQLTKNVVENAQQRAQEIYASLLSTWNTENPPSLTKLRTLAEQAVNAWLSQKVTERQARQAQPLQSYEVDAFRQEQLEKVDFFFLDPVLDAWFHAFVQGREISSADSSVLYEQLEMLAEQFSCIRQALKGRVVSYREYFPR